MVKHKIMKKIMETEELSLKISVHTISHKATPKHLSFGRMFFGS